MTDNDGLITKMVGKENPFRVPDGYFDSLAERVMANLPDADDVQTSKTIVINRPRRHANKAWLCVAASLCVAVFGSAVYLGNLSSADSDNSPQATTAQATNISQDNYVEEVADYAMMDNSDIYAYLASNE